MQLRGEDAFALLAEGIGGDEVKVTKPDPESVIEAMP